jgi:oligoendopeptidase F
LLNISHNIAKNINGSFNNKKYISDYEIPNIDIEQMKKIVIGFYKQVNPELSNKIAFILSKTDFIKYDENIPSNLQRSVTTPEGIKLYYKNDLKSLVTLAHEISHGISNLGDDLRLKDSKGVESLSEVESMLTEELFLEYLKNNNLQIKERGSNNEVRTLDDNIINDIKYDKYKGVIHTAYRAIDEL